MITALFVQQGVFQKVEIHILSVVLSDAILISLFFCFLSKWIKLIALIKPTEFI